MSNFDDVEITQLEHFDLYRLKVLDFKKHGIIMNKMIEEAKKKGSDKPMIFFGDKVLSATGTDDGRVWFSIEGNIQASVIFPHKYFKTFFEEYAWPLNCSANIHKVMDKYCPNTYYIKFPNDIVCKDGKKTVGIITRHYLDWQMCGFGLNLVDSPSKDKLRIHGLEACHMGAHCDLKIDKVQLAIEIAESFYKDIMEGYDAIESLRYYKKMQDQMPVLNKRVLIVFDEKARYPEVKAVLGTKKRPGFAYLYKSGVEDDNPFDDERSMYVDTRFETEK